MVSDELRQRAAVHAALGDPLRLAIAEELALSDRAPAELQRLLTVESNLLAHHLSVLEGVGLITRSRSRGDGRRRYVRLTAGGERLGLAPAARLTGRALFVCTRSSARSQLAAVLWQSITHQPAQAVGTDPAARVHPGAVAAAARIGLDLSTAVPQPLEAVTDAPDIVVTVCDQAHEMLVPDPSRLHWSITDPVPDGRRSAFDATVRELRDRISAVSGIAS